METASFVAMARQSVADWVDDYAPSMGAALAYYTLFLARAAAADRGVDRRPRLRARRRPRRDLRRAARRDRRRRRLPPPRPSCEASTSRRKGLVGTVVGLATLVVGAASVFGELQNALDRIWRAPARPARDCGRCCARGC
jgi:membrane protein